eukprot:jgi/Ulvmu1/6490/UM003_0123.1
MSTIRAQAHSSRPAQKQTAVRGGRHRAGSSSTPHVSAPSSPKSQDDATDNSEQRQSSFETSQPVVSSFDDSDCPAPRSLGYKDELEVRFIWDRVLGKGRNGTTTRVVIDRFSGTEYACKRMPKQAPSHLLPENATPEQRDEANELQLRHIRREITLFTKLRSSLNVARLEQIYEDATHVYLVMEKCSGPCLAEMSLDSGGEEQDVRNYMRSVVRTIVQCHDEDQPHAAVEPGKFRLLSEDRQSPVKATGFGRLHPAKDAGKFLGNIASMAPEMLANAPAQIGKNADIWAAGIMATRLLTEYFPFDDVLSNAVDSMGFLQPLAPVTSLLDDNPLMPSGAALFVSATVMLLDFTRPKWQPVSGQARDWVVKCLHLDQAARWSAADALEHPWLKRLRGARASADNRGDKEARRSTSSDGPSGVVQRIQRFGRFTEFKRSALEGIARRCMRQTKEYSQSLDVACCRSASHDSGPAAAAATGDDVQPDDTQRLVVGRRSAAAVPLPPAAAQPAAAGPAVAAGAAIGASKVQAKVKGGANLKRAKGLLEHMMVSDGKIDRFTLADGLEKLGYALPEPDLEHLLAQLSAVPGLTTSTAVTSASLAASQMDAAASPEEWREMARAAFDALDLDGDGRVQREEMEVVLAGRCPDDEVEQAIGQAMVEAGLPPDAVHLDYPAFMRLLSSDLADSSRSIHKFASMKVGAILPDGDTTSLSELLKQACSTSLIGRRRTSYGLDEGAGGCGAGGGAAGAAGGDLRGAVAAELAAAGSGGGARAHTAGAPLDMSDAYARAVAGGEFTRGVLRPVAEDAAAAPVAAAGRRYEPEVEMGRGGPPGGGGRGGRGVRGSFEGWEDGDAKPKALAPERLVRPGDKGPKLRARMSSDDRAPKAPPHTLESLMLQPQ